MAKLFRRFGIMLLAAALLTAAVPAAALAEDGTALKIDAANRYAGMGKSYRQGYIPAVKDGSVTVVLPLVLDGQSTVRSLKNNAVSVVPDFGSTATSPFVISNMETRFTQARHKINGTNKTVRGWLVSLKLPLSPRRTNGVFPLVLKVKYASRDGAAYTQSFTVYVTVNDAPGPAPKPRVLVSRYESAPDPVTAGQEFDLAFDIRNTSEGQAVRNVKVTVKGEGDDILPVSEDGTQYFETLGRGETKALRVRMKARFDAEAKPQKVTATVEYEDASGTAYTATGDMAVQVTQPVRLEFDKPAIAATAAAGDTIPVSLNVYNMGKNKLMNVMAKVEAPGLLPEGSAFIGNMDAGAGKTAELFVYVGTRDMKLNEAGDIETDPQAAELYGATSGFITVSYEDEFGNKMSKQVDLKLTITQPVVPTATPAPEGAGETAGQWWISVAAAGLIAAGIAAALVYRSRKRGKEVGRGNETD